MPLHLRHLGVALLLVSAALVIVAPPSWLTVGVASLAWLALSRDPRFGPFPAALAVVLALPYDRAADAFLLRVASIPVRPHDVAIGLAIFVSLPWLGRIRWSAAARLLALFGLVGIAALALGILNGQEPRDILRDARSWGLYVVAILSAGQPRPQRVLRGIFVGLGIYSLLVVAATLLPSFENGIKEPAIAFDAGILRMQFGNAGFLLLPIAYWAARLASRRRGWVGAGWLAWFSLALALSLTRVSIVTSVLVVILTAALVVVGARRRPLTVARGASAVAILVIGLALGLGLNGVGVGVERSLLIGTPTIAPAPQETSPQPTAPPVQPAPSVEPRSPLDRFVPELTHFFLSVGARFESYAKAMEVISASPVIGHGMGRLVDANYEFGAGEFATEGKLPNVDNAYLTIAMKAGVVGAVIFAALLLWPAWRLGRSSPHVRSFLLPAWLGLLVLTMTQSFAVTGHSPFVLGLLIVAIDRLPVTRRMIRE